jgi:hypothetical protein
MIFLAEPGRHEHLKQGHLLFILHFTGNLTGEVIGLFDRTPTGVVALNDTARSHWS